MSNFTKITLVSITAFLFLSACQMRGSAEDILPGVDVEVSTDGAGSSSSSGKDNDAAWNNGEHCPPGQEKKGKCNNDD